MNKFKNISLMGLMLLALAACGQAKTNALSHDLTANALQVIDKNSAVVKTTYQIEFAITQAEQEKGLMYRQSLAADQGMLFVFAPDSNISFWMKNTFIALDLIYADENGEIVDIKADNQPQSEVSIIASSPFTYCLEVNAGQAASHNILIGDKLVTKK